MVGARYACGLGRAGGLRLGVGLVAFLDIVTRASSDVTRSSHTADDLPVPHSCRLASGYVARQSDGAVGA